MNRLEIIATIDAEIERLQHARLLIIQSAAKKQPPHSHKARAQRPNIDKKKENRRPVERSHAAQPAATNQKPQVLVTRIAPKEPPKRRTSAATKSKPWGALTGDVPQGPIAAPAANREATPKATKPTTAPVSAFGLAIARGLATVGT